jgi:hypothetical protein
MAESPRLPPEHDAVRRLLADARHDGPPPPEVVARLDETLATLVAGRDAADRDASPGRVVDLGSRRRRVAGIGLLAAASVMVAGVAIGQVLPRGGDETSAGSASDTSLAEAPESRDVPSSEAGADDGAGAGAAELAPESLKSSAPSPVEPPPSLSSGDARLDEQVLALRGSAVRRAEVLGSVEALRGCDPSSLGRGRRLLAEVDGQTGVVVFRRPDGAAQQAEIFVCGLPDPVRVLTLPAP